MLSNTESSTLATMTMADLRLMMLVSRAGRAPVTLTWIASRTGRAMSTMSMRVDRLYKEGLIVRLEDPRDRRRVLVQLTAEGRDFLRKLRADLEACAP